MAPFCKGEERPILPFSVIMELSTTDCGGIDKRMVTLTLTDLGREMAAKVGAIEFQFYEANAALMKDDPLPQFLELLWRFVEGKPAGTALARRIGREIEDDSIVLK